MWGGGVRVLITNNPTTTTPPLTLKHKCNYYTYDLNVTQIHRYDLNVRSGGYMIYCDIPPTTTTTTNPYTIN